MRAHLCLSLLLLGSPSLDILGLCPALSEMSHKVRAFFVFFLPQIGELLSSLCFRCLPGALKELKKNGYLVGLMPPPSKEKMEHAMWVIMR